MSCSCNSGSGSTVIQGSNRISVGGSGTPTDPYIISEGSAGGTLQLEVRDSGTLNLTLFGSGTATDPYILRGDTSSASALRSLSDVSSTPGVFQGAAPIWVGSTAGGHFEFRSPGTRYTTRSTRGTGLYQGEVIKETDTGTRFEWDGSQWVDLTPAVIPPTALSPTILQDAGSLDPNTNWNSLTSKSGIYRVGTYAANVNGPSGAYNYGTLVVVISGNSVTQSYYEHGDQGQQRGTLWTRTKFNDSDWAAWRGSASAADISSLSQRINAEADARSADVYNRYVQLSGSINQEITDRTNGVNYVNGRIGQEISDRTAAVAQVQANAQAGDDDLRNRVGQLETTAGFGFQVAVNWTVNRATTWVKGSICQIDLSLTRQGTAISFTNGGDITNTFMGQVSGGYGVNGFVGLMNGPGGATVSGYINGVSVFLSAISKTINVGDEVTLCGTWIRS